MSYNERKKRRELRKEKKEKRYKRFIIFILAILLVFIILSLYNKNFTTTSAVEDVVLDQIELQAVVIKNEKIFESSNKESIEFIEGERIGVGEDLGQIDGIKNIDALSKELNKIEKAISMMSGDDTIKIDKNELQSDYDNMVSELKGKIILGDYEGIELLKNEIKSINKDLKELFPSEELLNENLETLKDKKINLESEIKEQDEQKMSKVSGIISYKVDGYENIFNPNSFEEYTFEKLSIPDKNIGELGEIEKLNNTGKFKIIDNLEWYLAIKVDDRKNIGEYDNGESLHINWPLEEGFIELEGEIISINNSSNKSVIVLKFDKYLYNFYNSRFPKVKLIKKKTNGLKIPNEVITEQEGVKGVFIKDFSGIVKFKPIKILSKTDNYTYIDKGNDGIISIEGKEKKYSTVSLFDEILLNPFKYKNGQILE